MCHDYGPNGRDIAWETTVAEEKATTSMSAAARPRGVRQVPHRARRAAADAAADPAVAAGQHARRRGAARCTMAIRMLKVPVNRLCSRRGGIRRNPVISCRRPTAAPAKIAAKVTGALSASTEKAEMPCPTEQPKASTRAEAHADRAEDLAAQFARVVAGLPAEMALERGCPQKRARQHAEDRGDAEADARAAAGGHQEQDGVAQRGGEGVRAAPSAA